MFVTRNYIPLLFLALIFTISTYSQPKLNCDGDTVNYVSIGTSEYGVGFGNPSNYSGVRLTGIDKNCQTNGLAMNLFTETQSRKTNGLDIGLSQFAENINGFSFGILSNSVSNELRGISVGLFLSEVFRLYGIGFTLGFQESDVIKGLSFSGASTNTFEAKGVLVSACRVVADSTLQGAAIAGIYTKTSQNKGLQLSPVNISSETRGMQLGLVNKTGYLNGAQFGLLNIVSERKHFRYMPLFNFGNLNRPEELNKSITNELASNASCGGGFINFNINTIKVDEYGNAITIPITTIDSIKIMIDYEINYKEFEITVGDEVIDFTESKRAGNITSRVIKIKKPEYTLIRIKSKKTNRCMSTSWKPNYDSVRILTDDDPTYYLQLSFSNTTL